MLYTDVLQPYSFIITKNKSYDREKMNNFIYQLKRKRAFINFRVVLSIIKHIRKMY